MTLTERYNQLVEFYNVAKLCADKLDAIKNIFPVLDRNRFTFGAFYRIFIPTVLPADVEKAIYLDGDTIVNLDISELWNIELGDKILGVVPTLAIGPDIHGQDKIVTGGFVKPEDYFNSGVLLMNLKLLRGEEDNIIDAVKFCVEHGCSNLADQPILNYCFATRTLKLPLKFNQFVSWARRRKESVTEKIYHYTYITLTLETNDAFNRLWMEYFMRTPFFDVNTIRNFCDEFRSMRNRLLYSAMNVSAMVSGKTRGFFIEAPKIGWLKTCFSIRDDEIIIPGENEESIQKLFDAMKAHKGKCVFFIMTPKFPKKIFPFNKLIADGFVEGVDFVKGWQFLAEDHLRFNTHSLVKAL